MSVFPYLPAIYKMYNCKKSTIAIMSTCQRRYLLAEQCKRNKKVLWIRQEAQQGMTELEEGPWRGKTERWVGILQGSLGKFLAGGIKVGWVEGDWVHGVEVP